MGLRLGCVMEAVMLMMCMRTLVMQRLALMMRMLLGLIAAQMRIGILRRGRFAHRLARRTGSRRGRLNGSGLLISMQPVHSAAAFGLGPLVGIAGVGCLTQINRLIK